MTTARVRARSMSAVDARRILVIANRTSSTPTLLHEVEQRAGAGARFTLMIPPDHGHHEDWTQEAALKLIERAAGGDVASLAPGIDPLDTVHRAVTDGEFDELIVCTTPPHLARWVHHDLPHRLQHLGLPVTVIPPERDALIPGAVSDALPEGTVIAPITGGGGEF
jgi:hypothetical protein